MVLSQAGQRSTRPGAWTNASRLPTSPLRPQLAHSVGAPVMSAVKTSEILQRLQLGRIEHIVRRSNAVEQTSLDRRARRDPMSNHRHQRHDTRAAAHQQQWATQSDVPDEVAADRATQLDLVLELHDIVQI